MRSSQLIAALIEEKKLIGDLIEGRTGRDVEIRRHRVRKSVWDGGPLYKTLATLGEHRLGSAHVFVIGELLEWEERAAACRMTKALHSKGFKVLFGTISSDFRVVRRILRSDWDKFHIIIDERLDIDALTSAMGNSIFE